MKEDEFARVYAEYHEIVLHLAFDILQDYDLSQYICQKVFVKFHKKMKKLDKWRVKGWLLRYVQRESRILSKRFYRKKKLRRLLREEVAVDGECFYEGEE